MRAREGENGSLGNEEPVGGNAERGMMVEASPTSTLDMAKADFLFQLEIIPLDSPALFRRVHEMGERDGPIERR